MKISTSRPTAQAAGTPAGGVRGRFSRWFNGRFAEIEHLFAGRTFVEDEANPRVPHDEASSLRTVRLRYRDTLRMIESELRDPAGRSFLDVGGGQLAWFVSPCFPCRTFAADFDALFADEARQLGVETRRWDLTRDAASPFEPETFDIVSFTEVLEHLPPPPFVYVRRVADLLKPGGLLLFSVPNMAAPAKRLKFALFGRSPVKLGQTFYSHQGYPEHIREYTMAEVRRILNHCGLAIERTRTGHYGRGVWNRAQSALDRILPVLGRTIIVRARKN